MIAAGADPSRLSGSGLFVVNPSWRLADQLAILLPALAAALAREGQGGVCVEWLAGEK
jgi:23S rRNA (adenine2030-N6)-methyltransferase